MVWAADDEDDVLAEGGGERQAVRCVAGVRGGGRR